MTWYRQMIHSRHGRKIIIAIRSTAQPASPRQAEGRKPSKYGQSALLSPSNHSDSITDRLAEASMYHNALCLTVSSPSLVLTTKWRGASVSPPLLFYEYTYTRINIFRGGARRTNECVRLRARAPPHLHDMCARVRTGAPVLVYRE